MPPRSREHFRHDNPRGQGHEPVDLQHRKADLTMGGFNYNAPLTPKEELMAREAFWKHLEDFDHNDLIHMLFDQADPETLRQLIAEANPMNQPFSLDTALAKLSRSYLAAIAKCPEASFHLVNSSFIDQVAIDMLVAREMASRDGRIVTITPHGVLSNAEFLGCGL